MLSPWEEGEARLLAVKAAIKLIVRRKANLSLKHRFAVLTFDQTGSIALVCGFTNSVSDVDAALDSVTVPVASAGLLPPPPGQGQEGAEGLDVARLLDGLQATLYTRQAGRQTAGGGGNEETYIDRCIMIYGRSSEVGRPVWCGVVWCMYYILWVWGILLAR
jgi:hypothetical protein